MYMLDVTTKLKESESSIVIKELLQPVCFFAQI